VCGLLGGVSRIYTDVLNRTRVVHGERFLSAYHARAPGQGLLTASNHVTAVDDPGIIAPLVPLSWVAMPWRLRWTLCAADRCFTNPAVGGLLSAGRVLPVERGGGPLQPHMDAVVGRLAAGDWVHMFPEGARQWPPGGPLGRLRPGLGRLIADAQPTPVVVPLYHVGLHALMPPGARMPWGAGNDVTVIVGQPMQMEGHLARMRREGLAERDIHVALTEIVGQAIQRLREEHLRGEGGEGGAREG